MTRTGRPKSDSKLVARTVRNSADVDATLVRMAEKYGKPLAKVLREACEEKAIKEMEPTARLMLQDHFRSMVERAKGEDMIDMANPPETTLLVELDPVEVWLRKE